MAALPPRALPWVIPSAPLRRLTCVREPYPSPTHSRCLLRSSKPASHPTQTPRRLFATSPSARSQTIEQIRSKQRSGPFTAAGALLFLTAGAGLIYYFRTEKARMERKRVAEMSKGVGKPKVGGAFELTDHDNKVFTDEDMKGGFSIVYFGFTHCPDICPEELDKLAKIIDFVNARPSSSISTSRFLPTAAASVARPPLLPLFITCDPARDTPSVLAHYLKEFHPGIVGLTGTWEQVKSVCKAYRVYFSTPPEVKAGEDYLVDHSIYFYVMDPEGDFIEAIGRQHSPETAARIIAEHMGDWEGGKRKE